jgi:hypothetical protein
MISEERGNDDGLSMTDVFSLEDLGNDDAIDDARLKDFDSLCTSLLLEFIDIQEGFIFLRDRLQKVRLSV